MDQTDYIVPEIEYELAMDDVRATPKQASERERKERWKNIESEFPEYESVAMTIYLAIWSIVGGRWYHTIVILIRRLRYKYGWTTVHIALGVCQILL